MRTRLMNPVLNASAFDEKVSDWRERMELIVATMREISRQTDPQVITRIYRERMGSLIAIDASLSVSRRGLEYPYFRITRSTRWKEEINPWKEKDRLPLLRGGFLADLLYDEQPRLFDEFQVSPDDPAVEYLDGYRSLLAIPMFDQGHALNMVLFLRRDPAAFNPEQFPDMVLRSNLFGRATHSLVLSEQLKEAYEAADYEMKLVARTQRSLLPPRIPEIPTMGLAAHYETSQRAGGDYYDFFPLPGGKWGLLIADVSGHGVHAAVYMAVTHSLAHLYAGPPDSPAGMLGHVNRHLTAHYTGRSDTFVTAFYGVYDPATRSLAYASAGHNPPRLKRCEDGTLALLNRARGLPLGVFPEETYREATHQLVPGDQLVLYTDGITEAENAAGEMFGVSRLDKVLENCAVGAPDLLRSVLAAVDEFTGATPAHDDRTLLVAKIS
jgi:sigma-B regulation protein RsbU (phosphoserine phosphatase)